MLLRLLFPPKCVLCRKLLTDQQTDLCHHCRTHAPEISFSKRKIPFVAQWTAIWYYKNDVRKSIHRFKFSKARRYAPAYARFLALKLQEADMLGKFDLITWVPISFLRHVQRGYDQSALLAHALAKELGTTPIQTLRKVRHTPSQSRFIESASRRANVLNAYRIVDRQQIADKRILLLDDVVTTGATASECAKTLLIAGAKEVVFASVAAAEKTRKY